MVRKQRCSKRLNDRLPLLFVVAVLVLSMVLAGCTGSDEVDPALGSGNGNGDASGNGDGASGASGSNGAGNGSGRVYDDGRGPFAFSHENLSVIQITESGSFGPTEHCLPINCLIGDGSHQHRVDLEAVLPQGIPMRIDVELERHGEHFTALNGWFLSDGAVWNISAGKDTYWGNSVIAALGDNGGKLHYVIESAILNPETEWTLTVTATPVLDRIPQGFAVGFQMDDPGVVPQIRSTSGTIESFMLWDSDDEHLGTFTTNSNITAVFQDNDKTGEFVMFNPWNSVDITIHSESGTSAPMRVLEMSTSTGTLQTPLPGQPVEWQFDLDQVPLAVGFLVQSDGGYTEIDSSARLESDAGVVMDMDLCGFCGTLVSLTTFWETWLIDGTHTAVIAGSYEADFANSGYGRSATHIAYHYER